MFSAENLLVHVCIQKYTTKNGGFGPHFSFSLVVRIQNFFFFKSQIEIKNLG